MSSYTPVRPHPLAGKRHRHLNANIWSLEFDNCVSKTRSTNEVVLQEERSATLLLPSHESSASLLPPVFNTQSSNSGLRTFVLRRPWLLPTSERGRVGINYSIFIYFCSHQSYLYGGTVALTDLSSIGSGKELCVSMNALTLWVITQRSFYRTLFIPAQLCSQGIRPK